MLECKSEHRHRPPKGANYLAPGCAEAEQTNSTSLNLFPMFHSDGKEKMFPLHIRYSPACVQTPTETLECAAQLTDAMWARQGRRLQEERVTELCMQDSFTSCCAGVCQC